MLLVVMYQAAANIPGSEIRLRSEDRPCVTETLRRTSRAKTSAHAAVRQPCALCTLGSEQPVGHRQLTPDTRRKTAHFSKPVNKNSLPGFLDTAGKLSPSWRISNPTL